MKIQIVYLECGVLLHKMHWIYDETSKVIYSALHGDNYSHVIINTGDFLPSVLYPTVSWLKWHTLKNWIKGRALFVTDDGENDEIKRNKSVEIQKDSSFWKTLLQIVKADVSKTCHCFIVWYRAVSASASWITSSKLGWVKNKTSQVSKQRRRMEWKLVITWCKPPSRRIK